jgi:hypothetical protein
MTKNTKIIFAIALVAIVLVVGIILLSSGKNSVKKNKATNEQSVKTENTAPIQPEKKENKLCDWIDKSDIIIKLNFAEGIEKDTSYEAGFYFSPTFFSARLARRDCDYRTGFNYSEFKEKGSAQVGARRYTDSRRRQLENEPISVVFDENGHPDIGSYIEITVKD